MGDSRFREFFTSAYEGTRAEKSALTFDLAARQSLKLTRPLGHPEFEHLQIGQIAESKNVIFFLDIRGFTKLAIVLENRELLRILQALTVSCVKSVLLYDGYVGEFTGDGVMAYFGDKKKTSEEAAFGAISTASFLMKGVRDVVNPALKRGGNEPIRVAVGMEFGDVMWSRIGLEGHSQVKPVSEVAFLAGKLSTKEFTRPWQCKTGQSLAEWIPTGFKERADSYTFDFDGTSYAREIYLFKWDKFADDYDVKGDLLKVQMLQRKFGIAAPFAATRIVQPEPPGRSGPRPLKDQPFF
jgi:class 3 adenylate cyclase